MLEFSSAERTIRWDRAMSGLWNQRDGALLHVPGGMVRRCGGTFDPRKPGNSLTPIQIPTPQAVAVGSGSGQWQ